MTESKICTCPSGDGSLVHPCPAHPAVEQAGGDERAAFEAAFAAMGRPVCRADYDQDAYGTPFDDGGWTGWQARAALAQPSQSQYEASFEEWLANELEGEDGQPVPAAVCDIALARRAFNHWPKLEHPAKVGGVRFSAGVSSRLVVEAAQRLYEFESTPEKEAERIERLQAFREQLDPLNLAPHAEAFNEAPADALRPEQAEAERPEVVARVVHSNPIVLGQCGPPNANDELMTVAQHAASVARWAEMFNRVEQQRDAALARVAELEALMQMNFGELHTARNLLSRLSVSGVNVDAILGGQLQDLVIVPADATLEMVEALKRSLTVTNRGTLLNAGHALNASIAASPFAKKAPEPVMCHAAKAKALSGLE
ncbi:TPA: hypothetical protein ACKQGD_005799 [Pseudomonas aeruginosa]